jgi:GNAT superfamily N-acetyltransferase
VSLAGTAQGIDAIEGIARECFWSFGSLPNARIVDDAGVKGVLTDVPIPFFNGIAMSHVDSADVAPVVERFRAHGRPFRWWVSPSTEPQNLPPLLAAQGFRHVYDSAGMMADLTALRLEAALPEDLTIEQVTDLTGLKTFFDVFVPVFSRPVAEGTIWMDTYAHFGFGETSPWSYFVGRLGGTPVATTAVLHCGELAGIYHVATLDPWRGRGIAAALTRAGMRHARRRGASRAALQASEMGLGVYRELGFVEHCRLTLYDWRPEYEEAS